jgi:hypothetical protein
MHVVLTVAKKKRRYMEVLAMNRPIITFMLVFCHVYDYDDGDVTKEDSFPASSSSPSSSLLKGRSKFPTPRLPYQ